MNARRTRTGAAVALAVLGLRALREQVVQRFGAPEVRRGTTAPADPDVELVALPGPGDATLRGLVLRASSPSGSAVVVHGWGGSAGDLLPVGRLLQEQGLDVLLLDARGHGRSDGTRLTSMPHIAQDLAAAVRWWRTSDLQCGRLILVGHSVGAGSCLLVARELPDVDGVILFASMADPRAVMRGVLGDAGAPRLLIRPALRLVEQLIGHRFAAFAPIGVLPLLDLPVLIVHGEHDATIPVAEAHALAAVAQDAELVIVPGAGHSDLRAIPAISAAVADLLTRRVTAAGRRPARFEAEGSGAGAGRVARRLR